jgi:hypothetical protein
MVYFHNGAMYPHNVMNNLSGSNVSPLCAVFYEQCVECMSPM